MDLLEYQGKQLFAAHGIAAPSGEVASSVEDAVAAAERIGYPCAIKAQGLIGGAGQGGGGKNRAGRARARAAPGPHLGHVPPRGPWGGAPTGWPCRGRG